MPLIQVKLIGEIFSSDQKQEMIEKITDAVVEIVGESIRPVTWVIIEKVKSGNWGIAGKAFKIGGVRNLQTGAVDPILE